MKMFPLKTSVLLPNNRKFHLRLLAVFIALTLVNGCLLTPPLSSNEASTTGVNTTDYGQYYLVLKGFSTEQLLNEIDLRKQQNIGRNTNNGTDIYLLLLKSAPNSPIYNPYNAKDQLNKLVMDNFNGYVLSNNDIALLTLLKDQLNEQLIALEHITVLEQEQALKQIKFNQLITEQQKSISELKQKLAQLKKIENSIDKHGQ